MKEESTCLTVIVREHPLISTALVSIPDLIEFCKHHPLTEVLTQNERRLMQGYRHERRRMEWLAGRLAAKRAARRHPRLHQGQRSEVLRLPSGAPYLHKHPGFSVSISHSGDLAAAVIAPFPIGIDIEQIAPRPEAFVNTWYTETERAFFASLAAHERIHAINRAWTYKEAVSKTIQRGGRISFKQICSVSGSHDFAQQITIVANSGLTDGYAMTVAYVNHDDTAKLNQLCHGEESATKPSIGDCFAKPRNDSPSHG